MSANKRIRGAKIALMISAIALLSPLFWRDMVWQVGFEIALALLLILVVFLLHRLGIWTRYRGGKQWRDIELPGWMRHL